MADTHIAKWGNSLAVRLPGSVVKSIRLAEGDPVSVDVRDDGSVVLRAGQRKYSLAELVSGITPKNRHTAMDWGGPRGREDW